jgi:tetratricopeptide (TPR) repeat protein
VLAAVLVSIARGSAQADWQVHRDDSRALVERAERALREQPDDDEVARRLVRLASRKERTALLARFRADAEREGSYTALAAYARLALALGEASQAAAAFDRALAISPRALPALTGRARALAAAGLETDALAAYDEALRLERRPGPRRHLLEAELGLLALRAGQSTASPSPAELERTVALRRDLAAVDPDRDGAAARLADALEQAGRPQEAAAALESRLPPGRAADKLPLALRAARLRIGGGASEAAAAMQSMLGLARQLPPSDGARRREVWAVALLAARRSGRLGELAQELGRLGDGAGAAEWDTLGQAREDLGDLEGALAALRAAAVRDPHDPDLAGRLVALLDRLGRDDEATRASEELARRIPSNPRFAIDVAERALRKGQRDQAAAALDRAIARFRGDRGALGELAGVASRWGLEERALAAWRRLARLDPRSEVALVGLGEAEFQRGHKDDARRTWAALRGAPRPSPAGHLRYAEVLFEHDFIAEAVQEARRAQTLDTKSAAPHRLLAQIFEREKKLDDAVTEWNVVLGLARAAPASAPTDNQASLRREARTRLLALYARQGRGRLDTQIRRLAVEASAHPEDTEGRLFLAEAQERAGDAEGAAATLRALLGGATAGETASGEPNGAAPTAGKPADETNRGAQGGAAPTAGRPRLGADVVVDATFGLVRLLKRNGQLEEAIARLDDVVRATPSRAREAHLQIAEISLARYDTTQALDHAGRAVAGADGPTLARIADVQLRAGDERAATTTYQQAVARDGGAGAALALVRLLEQRGDRREATDVLDGLLGSSSDEDTVVESGRLATDLAEVQGTLPELERRFADRLATRDTPAARRALTALLKRLVPPLYRDPRADETRASLGRQALRPLLELATDSEQPPDRTTVELIGMLGNGDAAPALARLLQAPTPARFPSPPEAASATFGAREPNRRPETLVSAETKLAAVVALGRLGDPRAASTLERLAGTADTALRAAAVWALGRVRDDRALPLLLAAIQDRRTEVAMAACLGLGRRGGSQATAALVATATDVRQPLAVRRAAILSLGRTAGRQETALLFRLVDSGDDDLATPAALTLAWVRDPSVVPGLLRRALLPRRFGLPDAAAPLAGLAVVSTDGGPPDEARLLGSPRLDFEGAIAAMVRQGGRRELLPLVRESAPVVRDTLTEALARGGDGRKEALAALDAPGDRIGLGELTSEDEAVAAPEATAAVRELVAPLADRLAALLDDPDASVRASALRVLAKIGDERVTATRIAAAVGDDSPLLAAAGAFAAGLLARDRPTTLAVTATALASAVTDPSWRRRLAAVEALGALGPAAAPALERARLDPNPIVRGAALDAIARHAIDLPGPPSTMP